MAEACDRLGYDGSDLIIFTGGHTAQSTEAQRRFEDELREGRPVRFKVRPANSMVGVEVVVVGDAHQADLRYEVVQLNNANNSEESTDRTMQRSFAEVIDWRVGTRMTHDPRTSRKAAEGAWE